MSLQEKPHRSYRFRLMMLFIVWQLYHRFRYATFIM